MSRQPNLFLAIIVAGLATASGCTVGSPSTQFGKGTGNDKGDMAENVYTPDGGTTGQDMEAPLTAPQPSTFSLTSTWTTVPLHGTTSPPNSAVIITAMDGTQTSADVDGSGAFCANMTLQPNKANTFQMKTLDINSGRSSESVSVTITQQGQPSTGQQTQNAENVALGGSGTVYNIGSGGTLPAQNVADGDTSTWTEGAYSQDGWSWPQPAVMVQLTATSSINKIVATLPGDCPMAATLVLAYSAQSAPAAPAPGASGWVVVNAARSSDGMTWSANFNAATATYIAAWWTNVNLSNTFNEGGCGFESSDFGLAELQGWTAQGVQQPPQTAPMCGL